MNTIKAGNIAFKFNYCDGRIGSDKKSFGFKNVCSKNFIRFNIEKRKADWCSRTECPCKQYYDGNITYQQLLSKYQNEGLCGESNLLNDWTASAEYTWDNGQFIPRTIKHARKNDLLVLTAVRPQMDEKSRKIFGMALISEVFEGNENESGYVVGNKDFRLEITLSEANNLNFWDYYRNDNTDKCRWGQGMFRYMTDFQAAQILKKVSEIKVGSQDKEKASIMLELYCKNHKIDINTLPEPSGALIENI